MDDVTKFIWIGLGLLAGAAVLVYYQRQEAQRRGAAPTGGLSSRVPMALSPADRQRLDTYYQQLHRYYEVDLMNRYASMKFDLASDAREGLLARFPSTERQMPELPFSLEGTHKAMDGILLYLEHRVQGSGQGVKGRTYEALKSQLEQHLAKQAHLTVLDAIKPHLRTPEDEAKWTRLRAEDDVRV